MVSGFLHVSSFFVLSAKNKHIHLKYSVILLLSSIDVRVTGDRGDHNDLGFQRGVVGLGTWASRIWASGIWDLGSRICGLESVIWGLLPGT